jgi:hypothetical protein
VKRGQAARRKKAMFGQVFLGTFKKRRIPIAISDGRIGKVKAGVCFWSHVPWTYDQLGKLS